MEWIQILIICDSVANLIRENKIPDSCGIIMAGGKSSRMGTDKSMLKINDKSLSYMALENLKSLTENQILSTNRTDIDLADVATVSDIYKEVGPAGGIFSCLEASINEINVFQSVDTPFVTPELYFYLYKNIEKYDCIIPMYQGRKEPLLGIYRKQCSTGFQKQIDKKQYKLMEILKHLNATYIEINTSHNFYTESLFFNINKPEDFQKAKKFFV